MPKIKHRIKQQKILLEDRFFLHAYVANDEQRQLLNWWNALLPKVEFSVECRENPELGHEEYLEILGKEGNAVFRFSWDSKPSLLSFEDGCIELHLPLLLGPKALQKNLGFQITQNEHFLMLEEGARRTLLLDLNFLGGRARPMLREIAAILSAAVYLGHNSIEMSRNLHSALIHLHTPKAKDKQTGLEFFDLSSLHQVNLLDDLLDHLDSDSLVVLGGSIKSIPQELCDKMFESNHCLILLEMFGPIQTPSMDEEYQSHVQTFAEAVDMCLTLAEQPGKAYFITGLNLQEATAKAMARRFQMELALSK